MKDRVGKATVLLVGADAALRTVVRLHLGAGFEVVDAEDEATAFDLLGKTPVDVVVCTGHGSRPEADCLKTLRGSHDARLRAIPVLLVVAASTPPAARDALRALGSVDVLAAPVTGPRLAAAIARLLGRGP